jgi:hypothetical protein
MGRLTQSTAEIQEILDGYNALKEQVEKLAGASIDETLMKYLANPYVITRGEQIPEDLHNLIFEEGRGLKPVVMSVCVIGESGDDMRYSIEFHNTWSIYSSAGQENIYNRIDRVFE